MFGAGVWETVVGAAGTVLVVCAVLLSRRWGARRCLGAAGAGLLLLGLSVSGVVGVIAQALAVGLNPVRWIGLAAAGVGALMLSWAGMLPGRRRRRGPTATHEPREAEGRRGRPPAQRPVEDDLGEIEDILRRRGIE